MINNVNLTLLADVRSCSLVRGDRKFRTSELYGILKRPERTEEAMASFIWNNKTPPRVQFFAWLLAQEKTQCKTNLRKKRILEEDVCEECAWSVKRNGTPYCVGLQFCQIIPASKSASKFQPDLEVSQPHHVERPTNIPKAEFSYPSFISVVGNYGSVGTLWSFVRRQPR
jgi:hypothetical protein